MCPIPALQRSAMCIQLIELICSNYAIMTKISTYAHPSMNSKIYHKLKTQGNVLVGVFIHYIRRAPQ